MCFEQKENAPWTGVSSTESHMVSWVTTLPSELPAFNACKLYYTCELSLPDHGCEFAKAYLHKLLRKECCSKLLLCCIKWQLHLSALQYRNFECDVYIDLLLDHCCFQYLWTVCCDDSVYFRSSALFWYCTNFTWQNIALRSAILF